MGCYRYTHPDGKVELLAVKKLKDIPNGKVQQQEEDYLAGEINLYRKVAGVRLLGATGEQELGCG